MLVGDRDLAALPQLADEPQRRGDDLVVDLGARCSPASIASRIAISAATSSADSSAAAYARPSSLTFAC